MEYNCGLVYFEFIGGITDLIKNNKLQLLWLVMLMLLLTACGKEKVNIEVELSPQVELEVENTTSEEVEEHDGRKGIWCVYWDDVAYEKFREGSLGLPYEIDEFVMFACFFDQEGEIYVPPQLEKNRKNLSVEGNPKIYLSFVNDVLQEDGNAIQKSPEFLKELLSDQKKMEESVDDMVSLTKSWNYQGIELDFENIDREDNLWNEYLDFVALLCDKTQENNLALRVVLPAYSPVDDYEFPSGPEYTVMCYNLYGNHSGPGPKADFTFLKEVANRYKNMENVRFALANGGFDWGEDGVVVDSMTSNQAKEMAKIHKCNIRRDIKSEAITFNYQADDGFHTVWYGDVRTVEKWEEIINEELGRKVKIDLWRAE